MKAIGAGLLWLASVTGAASADFSVDIENHARWAVLDGLPEYATGRPISVQVSNLRTNDLVTAPVLISAVCGNLAFASTDDGTIDFIVFYSNDDDGRMVVVGRPFLYGQLSERNTDIDPQYEAAMRVCGDSAAATAVVTETRTVAQTEAAAITAPR